MKFTFLFFVLVASVCYAQDDGPINIYLNSGKVISTRYVYIDQGGGFMRAFVRINPNAKEKIMIDEVDYIEGPDNDGKLRHVRPIKFQGRSVWGERTFQSDRITMYFVGVTTWGVGFPSNTKYYQYTKDDGPLTKVTIANVQADVFDSPESMAFVKKSKVNVGLQAGFFAAGITLAIASAVKWANEDVPTGPGAKQDTEVKIPPMVFVGVALCVVPAFIRSGKQKNLVQALEVYK
ncbi:MAG TPA: hypothetical protein VFE50_23355 [Cyclobacteriaceae bacterium]|nr:hypothetical protein [Cyclobacteriaceae bacterium]